MGHYIAIFGSIQPAANLKCALKSELCAKLQASACLILGNMISRNMKSTANGYLLQGVSAYGQHSYQSCKSYSDR